MRQFMERFDLLVTPTVAVPAFEARPAGHSPMTPEAMLGWTPFSYPFNLTQQPACTMPVRAHARRPADRPAARRPDVRRRRSCCAPPAPTNATHPIPRPPLSSIRVSVVLASRDTAALDWHQTLGWVERWTYQAARMPPTAPKRWPVNEMPGRGSRPQRMPP